MHQKINIIQQDSDLLLIIDPQNDLFPGGANQVPDGHLIIEPIIKISPLFKTIYISLIQFTVNNLELSKLRYCVYGSWGAEQQSDLYFALYHLSEKGYKIISYNRGANVKKDSKNYPFAEGIIPREIKQLGVRRIFIAGLPLETTVKEVAPILKNHGFEVIIFEDATRPQDPKAGKTARQDLEIAGIQFMRTTQFFE